MATIPHKFYETVEKFGDKPALSAKKAGLFESITFHQLKDKTWSFASGLMELGLKKGDKIVLLSENRPEWVIADIGMLQLGIINVPVFVNSSPEDLEYVINHCEARALILSGGDTLNRIKVVQQKLTQVKMVISMEKCGLDAIETRNFDGVIALGRNTLEKNRSRLEEILSQVDENDTASIIYTSGTTGIPKGVMLSHRNFISNVETCSKRFNLAGMVSSLSFLPMCHVLERTAGYYTVMFYGVNIHYAESVETVPRDLLDVKPDIVVSVPRLYEKMYTKVLDAVKQGSAVKKKIFSWAVETGGIYFNNLINNISQPTMLSLKMKIAEALVFKKLKERLGGKLQFFISGGAPLSKDIAEFFGSAGIFIYEGYGLTETSPVIAANYEGHIRLGTVGTPLENSEIKIADDKEILFKGPGVMKGYFKNDEATAEVIDSEGWLHTGDIGELEDGYLKITDRKKDIIVTASGKNVAPQAVENALKMDSFITEAAVFGDKKPYLVALIVPDFDKLKEWAQQRNILFANIEELINNEDVGRFMKERINHSQERLSSYSQVKKFRLLPTEFSINGNEITPSMKLRRKFIGEKNSELIEKMYHG